MVSLTVDLGWMANDSTVPLDAVEMDSSSISLRGHMSLKRFVLNLTRLIVILQKRVQVSLCCRGGWHHSSIV